jgi:hypothetical protein
MNCPICGKQADALPRLVDAEGFRCASCGDYEISGTVLRLESWKNLRARPKTTSIGKCQDAGETRQTADRYRLLVLRQLPPRWTSLIDALHAHQLAKTFHNHAHFSCVFVRDRTDNYKFPVP